ncbi:glycerol acyltransferase [Elizabethkingia meningoseptica]|uniref:Glycerol acyltransferase n=1 Tax=Elizabethkingia meningoseptica TaxID=238 RepID=A0A1T3FHD5_ELIME|nr:MULTISPECIES: 1-acyl-sn-glycerol-3-phosphate acyltransferase [Elizabethkingia]AQX12597.1 glycerol acyltransferase [Elizabethkingia meningoseptica]MBG0514149.1 glycerol acyltransferase [Elizabethkingia meningoseptica]MDE5433066.1 glycerol acyltransferase [Elizabethkingia meningoseptica]MDE5448957.1 glycerol acyltransferase [Elizabethkingia meningoseptica]MDE5471571.1 glycerol acyltransferase [Elizabethkingia meningoseptica]
MKKFIGSFFLKLLGWTVGLDGDLSNLDRCILVEAPHTSNWDYLLGIMVYWKYGKRLKVIIKDSHTKAFYGGIVKSIGAIGIDRSQKNDLINIVAREFDKEDFSLVITPEGSRSYAKKWKLGFYHMALQAKVPIVLASGDYKYKKIKIGYKISYEDLLSRSFESVMDEIENYFKTINAKYPENYNPKIY